MGAIYRCFLGAHALKTELGRVKGASPSRAPKPAAELAACRVCLSSMCLVWFDSACKAPAYSPGPCRGSAYSAEHKGGGSSLLAGSKARGGGLSPVGSEPATWCGLVGGLTERERGTVCAGRASALLRGACCGGPFSATRADYVTRQTHVFHERGIRVRRGAVAARGAELLWVLALWAAG